MWHGQPVPEREWGVPERFPLRNVGLFSGEGAVGKSISPCSSAPPTPWKDWLDAAGAGTGSCTSTPRTRRTSCTAASTDLDHYNTPLAELKDMHLLALAGQDAVLGHPDRNGLIAADQAARALTQAARDIRPKIDRLDTSADIFAGNENDRAQVRQFIGLLRGLAIAANAGVVLTSHPSLTGISSGTGLSGNTAWHASRPLAPT